VLLSSKKICGWFMQRKEFDSDDEDGEWEDVGPPEVVHGDSGGGTEEELNLNDCVVTIADETENFIEQNCADNLNQNDNNEQQPSNEHFEMTDIPSHAANENGNQEEREDSKAGAEGPLFIVTGLINSLEESANGENEASNTSVHEFQSLFQDIENDSIPMPEVGECVDNTIDELEDELPSSPFNSNVSSDVARLLDETFGKVIR